MNNDSIVEIFLDYFLTFRLKNKLSFLSLHVNHPQEGTPRFLKSLRDIASDIKFDNQKFNQLLDDYLNTTNKDDLNRLNKFIDSHHDNIQNKVEKIPNDLNKAYSSLKGLIGSKFFENHLQCMMR